MNDGDFPRQRGAVHLMVVLDHREARAYLTEIRGFVPGRITPYDPRGYGAHLHTSDEHTDGKSVPERKSFYEAIAKTLRGAEQILLFGSGTGKSSAMEQLVADLMEHHADVAGKIIGTVKVDAHHTTENQLLAKPRDFYAEFNRACSLFRWLHRRIVDEMPHAMSGTVAPARW